MTLTVDTLNTLNGGSSAASTPTANEAGSAERFLKLLVAQMQNQDPLNPTDNAQVTTQMAQINTVTGIDKLNTTVQSLSGQFAQLQALQGISLVGREVTVPGNRMWIEEGPAQGQAQGVGGFELSSPADRVKVEVLSAAGLVLDTLELGASGGGRHGFDWSPRAGTSLEGVRFRVTATTGTTAVAATPLMRDRIEAVSTAGGQLTLETQRSGQITYDAVKAFN
jgi:flagellar basal-body rod modification protein FlgD